MDQQHAPIYEALRKQSARREAGFHVPGHKFGQGAGRGEREHFRSIMELDYTEIEGMDDLHHPQGMILEAQELAAACFGAEESHFLVGGSTAGNLALLTCVCARGDVILVQRNAHKSVIHGLMLAGAQAVFLQPAVDGATGIAGCVTLCTLEEALRRYPYAKGVFLTNPNYYGMGRNLRPYAEAAHRYGMPLLVDEAHGAHFGFHGDVPPSALSCGADAVVQSTHKMLTAMTMGAMLHVQGSRINRKRLKERLAMLQSSSPSYPLMASIDLARRNVAVRGRELLERTLRNLQTFKQRIDRSPSAPVRLAELGHGAQAYDYADPFKLVLCDASGRRSGFQLLEELADRGIIAEMADERHVVLACSLATPSSDLDRLAEALDGMNGPIGGGGTAQDEASANPARPCSPAQAGEPETDGNEEISEPVRMELTAMGEQDMEAVKLEDAAGRISAQSVIPYPPGIPLLFPGERIRPAVVEQIRILAQAGARFQGREQDEPGCSILVMRD